MRYRIFAECFLITTLAISGAVLAARTVFGTLAWPVSVNSPINAEGVFAVAALLLMALRSTPGQPGIADRRSWWPWAIALALLIAVVFWRSAHDYFLSDDFVILHHAREYRFDVVRMFTSRGADGFLRPMTYLSYALTLPWTGVDPLRFHTIGFALHAITTLLVFALAREISFDHWAAVFAAALFAVHGTRPETVVWISGRFDQLATLFVLLAILLFVAARGRHLWIAGAMLAMIAGILCKESAYACPLLMALFVDRRHLKLLAPFFAAAAALFAYRWMLFGGIGGYVTTLGTPQALSVSPLSVIKTLGFRLWANLFFAVNWSMSPGVLLAIAMVLYLAALIWLAATPGRFRHLMVGVGFILIAAIPPVQQLLIGPDLLKARYLYLPSVGFCLLLGGVAQKRWLFYGAVLAFHIVALEHNLTAWQYAAARTQPACRAAAACNGRAAVIGLPRVLNGVYFFQNGFPECVRMEQPNADVTMRDHPLPPEERAAYSCVFTWDNSGASLLLEDRQMDQ